MLSAAGVTSPETESAFAKAESKSDPLHGKRLHAWVLIRGGKRGVSKMSFVEPTTGRMYRVEESPYLGLESCFNGKVSRVVASVNLRSTANKANAWNCLQE